MKIQHDKQLFTTIKYEIGNNTEFTIYGFKIEDGEIKIHFVNKFSKPSSTAKTWRETEIYHSTVMQKRPDDVVIPNEIFKKAKLYFKGFIVDTI